MISDRNLAAVSLAVAAAGLISLLIITLAIEPKEVAIKDISGGMTGQQVVVRGNIASYRAADGNVFITLKDGEGIKVVMFSREAQKQPWVYGLKKGDYVSAHGRVQLYKNELEIVAETIKAM